MASNALVGTTRRSSLHQCYRLFREGLDPVKRAQKNHDWRGSRSEGGVPHVRPYTHTDVHTPVGGQIEDAEL